MTLGVYLDLKVWNLKKIFYFSVLILLDLIGASDKITHENDVHSAKL